MNAVTEIRHDVFTDAEMIEASLASAIDALKCVPLRAKAHILDRLQDDCERLMDICENAQLARMRGF